MDGCMIPIVVDAERCGYYGGSYGGAGQDQEEPTEYYFFSYKDRKYPSGTRTNRATAAGFWKATGRDKPVLSSTTTSRSSAAAGGISVVIGMRKTLVFYRGRAPNGRKTDWIIHEYRLQSNEHAPAQEEGWVVCRAFQKPMPNQQHIRHAACYYPSPPGSYLGAAMPAATYYYDGPVPAPRLLMNSGGGAVAAAAPPAAAHDHGGGLAAESKLQVQLLADMPPLHSPSSVDGGVVQHHSYNDQIAAAAVAAESTTVDWNLLSSLLPPAQLNFHHTPPPESPSSCSKNNNDAWQDNIWYHLSLVSTTDRWCTTVLLLTTIHTLASNSVYL